MSSTPLSGLATGSSISMGMPPAGMVSSLGLSSAAKRRLWKRTVKAHSMLQCDWPSRGECSDISSCSSWRRRGEQNAQLAPLPFVDPFPGPMSAYEETGVQNFVLASLCVTKKSRPKTVNSTNKRIACQMWKSASLPCINCAINRRASSRSGRKWLLLSQALGQMQFMWGICRHNPGMLR